MVVNRLLNFSCVVSDVIRLLGHRLVLLYSNLMLVMRRLRLVVKLGLFVGLMMLSLLLLLGILTFRVLVVLRVNG